MNNKNQEKKRQTHSGDRKETLNINERIFAALETDYEPLQEWETRAEQGKQLSSEIETGEHGDEPYLPL